MTVVTTSEARSSLNQIATGFDEGEYEPVIFGSHRRAQGVIIPVALWEYFLEQAEDEVDLKLSQERLQKDRGTPMSLEDVRANVRLRRNSRHG